MKHYLLPGMVVFLLCSCADVSTVSTGKRTEVSERPALPELQESARPACDARNVMQARTRQHYEDQNGTMMTTDPFTLSTRKTIYRWGIANQKPLETGSFAACLKPMGKFAGFNAKIYMDSGVKEPMIFFFRNGDRERDVLKSVTVNPGQTVGVDFPIRGVKKIFVGSEVRAGHGKVTRIIIGEPEFYNCR